MAIIVIVMIVHRGKGLEPRTFSGRESQNPRVAMVFDDYVSRYPIIIYDDLMNM